MLVCGVDDVWMDQISIGDVIPPSPAVVGGGRNCVMRHGPTTVLATQPSQPSPASPAQHRAVIHAEALVLTHFYRGSCGGLPP